MIFTKYNLMQVIKTNCGWKVKHTFGEVDMGIPVHGTVGAVEVLHERVDRLLAGCDQIHSLHRA